MTRTAPAPLATGCSPAVQGPYGSQRHLALWVPKTYVTRRCS